MTEAITTTNKVGLWFLRGTSVAKIRLEEIGVICCLKGLRGRAFELGHYVALVVVWVVVAVAVTVVVPFTHPRPHAISCSTVMPEGMLRVTRLTAPDVNAGNV